jgi:hypothetical protein
MTFAELKLIYESNVDDTRYAYHVQGTITHNEYHQQLNAAYTSFEQDVIDEGYVEELYPITLAETHWAKVSAFDPEAEKPLEVKRAWHGKEVSVDCYVTQSIKDAYLAETLVIGDFVLIVFVDGDIEKPLAVEEIVQTW